MMKKVHFNLCASANPYTGMTVYSMNIMMRLIEHWKDWKYEGGVSFNIKNRKNLNKLGVSVHISLVPYRVLFRKRIGKLFSYGLIHGTQAQVYIFWGNELPQCRIHGKCITVIHDINPYVNSKEKIERSRYALRNSDVVVTVSEFSRQELFRKIPEAKGKNIKIVYNGVDFERFYHKAGIERRQKAASKYQLPERFILYIGSTYTYKNIGMILKAYASLAAEKRKDIKFVCSNTNRELEELARKLCIESDVKFLNGIDEEDKVVLYQMAYFTVNLSLYEGFGIPVIESMAAGTPVICSDTSALPEVAGDAALYASPDNLEDVIEKMEELLDNEILYQTLKEKGYENAYRFTWEASAERFAKIISEL